MTAAPKPRPALDPTTASLYETVDAETFSRQRARFSQQTGELWASEVSDLHHHNPMRQRTCPQQILQQPRRNTIRQQSADPDLHTADTAPEHALLNHAFQVTALEARGLPQGWSFNDGYLVLTTGQAPTAQCLIRHHLVPRRRRLRLQDLPKDSPYTTDQLDQIRVTVMYDHNGITVTDDGADSTPTDRTWTGLSIFQIKGDI